MSERRCYCGSGKPAHALNDARGIFCAYVCDDCERSVAARYRTDVFDDPNYPTDEPVDALDDALDPYGPWGAP